MFSINVKYDQNFILHLNITLQFEKNYSFCLSIANLHINNVLTASIMTAEYYFCDNLLDMRENKA